MDVKKNVPQPDEVVLLKKYVAWHFDQHAKKNPEQMCVVLLDMTGASVANLVSVCTIVASIAWWLAWRAPAARVWFQVKAGKVRCVGLSSSIATHNADRQEVGNV